MDRRIPLSGAGRRADWLRSHPVTLVPMAPPTVRPDTTEDDILSALQGRAGMGVPVVSVDLDAVIGWITYQNVLARMRFALGVGWRGSG